MGGAIIDSRAATIGGIGRRAALIHMALSRGSGNASGGGACPHDWPRGGGPRRPGNRPSGSRGRHAKICRHSKVDPMVPSQSANPSPVHKALIAVAGRVDNSSSALPHSPDSSTRTYRCPPQPVFTAAAAPAPRLLPRLALTDDPQRPRAGPWRRRRRAAQTNPLAAAVTCCMHACAR